VFPKMKSSHRPLPNVVKGATEYCWKLLGTDAVKLIKNCDKKKERGESTYAFARNIIAVSSTPR
jgi:hypothetical protein